MLCTTRSSMFFVLFMVSPKIRFPTCPVYQNMTFSHISYTYLAEDRAEFWRMNETCQKCYPILQISYMYEIQIFI